MIERLKEMSISRIIVFGSAASGETHEDSDLDIAVVVPDPENRADFNRTEFALEVRKHLRDVNAQVALDIVVYTASEFEKLASQASSLRAEIIEGGETVYERAG
ncbi:MAG: nucleotidyltransferase domain-containing protein [Spirochaetaceae bacterium]